ncbi:hypothetical protein M2150_000893, partial [Lachnospiraceae bacterium PM6-15]
MKTVKYILFLVTSATLDSMAKQCCNVITDGEETQEQNSSSSKS